MPLGGVPGVSPAKVVIIGGGIVETNAAKMAAGAGADVTILDTNVDRLRQLMISLLTFKTRVQWIQHFRRSENSGFINSAVLIPAHVHHA